jgi:hypothetical protein
VEDVSDDEDMDFEEDDLLEEGFYLRLSHLNLANLIRYAARFISAYAQSLTGPEGAWANRKYHGHRTLPPDMALKLKKEHEKKYSTNI